MKIINKNRMAATVAVLSMATVSTFSGVAEAKSSKSSHKNEHKHNSYCRHDNGKHKGWDKGKHKGWDKKPKSSHTSYPRYPASKPSVSDVWRRSTNPTPSRTTSRRLVGTFYHTTQAEAAKAVRFAQSKGLYATSTYSSSQRVWIVRTYTR